MVKKVILSLKNYGLKKTMLKIFEKILARLQKNISSEIIEYRELQKHYNDICVNLKKKIKAKQKITVAFFVIYDSAFPSKQLFEKMLSDDVFDPIIIIAPDTHRGKENMLYQLDKSYQGFKALYGEKKVLLGYIEETNNFIDFSEYFNVFCFSNPYDAMTYTFFQMNYLKQKNVLTFYISYGHSGILHYSSSHIINAPIMNYFWKIFAEYEGELNEYRQWQGLKGKNVIVSGFYRSAEYLTVKKIPRQRKCIILAPHHTIGNEYKDVLVLSNFLEYADFFLKLPQLYPDIDFIFRPHPLLITRLEKDDMWGKRKTDAWLNVFFNNKNLTYSEGNDFAELLFNSDALIHDCGSFIIDYLFTGKPCCFMYRKDVSVESTFTEFGIKCLKQYYKAFTSTEIIDFIDDVVIKKADMLKRQRNKFVRKYLPLNQNVSEKIIKEIKKAIVF